MEGRDCKLLTFELASGTWLESPLQEEGTPIPGVCNAGSQSAITQRCAGSRKAPGSPESTRRPERWDADNLLVP